MTVSTIAGTETASVALLTDGGITARGGALLDLARDAFVDDPDKYSMIEKLHISWDMGDAWMDRGWFTTAEKKESQKVVEASMASGPNSFFWQMAKFEEERAADVARLGPDMDSRKALAFFKTYQEPWKQEYLKAQITNLEITFGVGATLKSRDGQNGFDFTRDTRDGISLSVAHIKDPIARQALELMRDFRVSQNFGAWRDRQAASDKVLASLKQLGSSRADVVSLSKEAQAYLQTLKRLADPDAGDDTSEWRLKLLQTKPGTRA